MGFGQRPPPSTRRPYRETVPNPIFRKSEPATNRRPRLDYRSSVEYGVSSPYSTQGQGNPPIFQYPTYNPFPPQDALITDTTGQTPQWQAVPVYAYPIQEQHHSSSVFSPLLIPVTPSQLSLQSPSFADTSSNPVYNSSPLIQHMQQPTMQNYFVSNGYSGTVHIIPDSQQSSHHSLQQHQLVSGTLINGQPQTSLIMPSHPSTLNQQQSLGPKSWLAQGPEVVRVPEATNQQHLKYSQVHSEHKELDMIKNLAFKFVQDYCPLIDNTAYCHPPVLRYRHPDKASKQLKMGMESEQRVIGSFERYFAANQMPVFMLCHYPVTGFLQEHHRNKQSGKESADKVNTGNRETVTLILVSHKFCVTAVTVSIISSNSDFSYIQRGVAKAAGHVAKCGRAVAHWLTHLGLAADVREVLAFPNLRQSMMQRIARDKALQKSLSKVRLLHLDDLPPPFEEEWSTPALKRQFTEWMQKHVLSHPASLSPIDVQLFVGALLCPQLSCVENMKNVHSLYPIPENPSYIDKEPTKAEDIGQLQLTINGITMGFDDFMEKYVTSYYPDVETKTYRVPPLHFNIQSFRKGSEYVNGLDLKNSLNGDHNASERSLSDSIENFKDFDNEEEEAALPDSDSNEDFMPSGRSYCWQAGPVTGRQDSAYAFDEDESPDSKSMPHQYRRLPVERVTLDSIPNHAVQVHFSHHLLDTPKNEFKDEVGLPRREKAGSLLPNVPRASQDRFSPLSHKPNGVPPLVGEHYQPVYSGNPYRQSTIQGGEVASLGVRLDHPVKPVVKSPSLTLEEAQAYILEDTNVMANVMAKDARADEGENRVINAMELLGQTFGPMFIICSYQYNNYLNKLREEMFSKGEATRPTRAFGQIMRAEHDCLIFHKDLGVLVVCIKAIGDNFSDWNASQDQIMASTAKILHKALKQLEREEAMIRHVTSDLKSRTKLVCHCLVALPNMYRSQVDAALATDVELFKKIEKLTYGRGSQSFLCRDELPEKNMSVWDPPEESVHRRLADWWKNLRKSLNSPDNAIDTKTYKHIIGRYCGLLSTVEVWSPNNPRVEVRSMSEAVNLCAHRFSQVVLLPTQLQVLMSDHNRIYLYGPPGSGKTLLLVLKAREWLLRGHTVILINSRWGSTDGYPYAYGILDRLKIMMTKDGVPHDHLVMINVDTKRFHHSYLSDVLPTRCVIIDEVTPATLPIIEHLSCLQVQNIWCAGLFLEYRPHTAHHFQAFKMEKVLRCPPIVQSLLKHTENVVKLNAPYKDIYEESSSPRSDQLSRGVLPFTPQGSVKNMGDEDSDLKKGAAKKETNTDGAKAGNVSVKQVKQELSYDADSLNERLAKFTHRYKSLSLEEKADPEFKTSPKAEDLSSLISNRVMNGLPTDGPRPHIIDHQLHDQPGAPSHCLICGRELADFLLSMVKTEIPAFSSPSSNNSALNGGDFTSFSPNSAINAKNRLSLKGDGGRGRTRKGSGSEFGPSTTRKSDERINFAGVSASDTRLRNMFDNRALSWSDVIIVMSKLSKNSALLKILLKRGIPLEVLESSKSNRVIETSKERQRLFVTTYSEVIGLERALLVFVPSDERDDYGGPRDKDKDEFTELKNLSLRKCLQRYNEEDRRHLWFMASRCLSDLVLLLP